MSLLLLTTPISFIQLVQSKDEEICKLREELTKLRQSYDDISSFCEESVMAASRMEQKAEDLKVKISHYQIYHHVISGNIRDHTRGLNM